MITAFDVQYERLSSQNKLNSDTDLDSDAPDFRTPLNVEIVQVVPVRLLPPLHLWRLRLRESEGKVGQRYANVLLRL